MNHPILTHCPICSSPTSVTEIRCDVCDITIEGHFMVGGLGALTPEQLEFVEVFLRCEGKINRVEKELGISYPTVRGKLTEIIADMGYEPVGDMEAEEAAREEYRREVLDKLANDELSPDEAVKMLRKTD